ncbi:MULTISPECIES: DEAD/DEAH box helicase [unclassified Enterococcus]|uniref:DEAD/DEAH box helicase n=1 Tax=unclassified Enterococcus TaxID=2608891 RepID=UPI001555F194|nr:MULTISPECIES: DEAD/DEAH box helicase [unclassified Enterococcus]MBS7577723.1 DEAD/DEAH box helicase [Enterococcus sp. MMGLQ5-2]MBS7584083.1 DEAD/DEAH box helicase [Enterococcus sp. MMGLQ5-1]NPD11944.1 DEAD/DEAH box helicase [Enterococcus sp. MMGLQ5-1]NPD37553.1 DEAD/DEAH box helicase [Enterococcus sp. MMGLQ5-2]
MKFVPHEYQQYSIDFIKEHKIAALLLEMGLGKTVTTLTAIKDLMFDDFAVKKVLIIAPLRVTQSTWPSEIEKWDHLKDLSYSVVLGNPKQRIEALYKKADLYLINRENLDWLITKSDYDFDFDMVVIDELSSFKNYKAKRFTSLMKVRHKIDRIVGLTGTPSSNGLMDLFAEFKVLDMGERLEYYISRYRDKYFLPDKRNGMQIYSWKPRENAEQEIYDKISDITISMKSVDFLDMPELVINEVPVSLEMAEKQKYDKFKADLVLQLKDADIDAANAAVLSNKLLQMANGAIYDEFNVSHHIHDQKLDTLEDLIEGANGKPILIAYWFQHDLERIKERFKVRRIKTATDIEEWNKGNIPVAVIHPASAGHGLNLQTGGSNLVWFGLTWSLELYQQTNARLWRQGQNETVVIHHIIAKDTIDEDVMLALKLKDKTQSSLIDAVKARLEGEG